MSGAALLYFGVRAVTKGSASEATAHASSILGFERLLHIGVEASFQQSLAGSHAVVTLANWVYIFGHWPVIIVALIWLYRSHRDVYVRLRNAMFISGAIGLVIFWLFPVAPPRYMPGFIDTVTDFSHTYRVLQPPSIENRYASLPSLHVGWNLLVGLTVAATARQPAVRLLGALSPLAMATAVVVTGNHYLVDVVLGSAIAGLGFVLADRLHPQSAVGVTAT